MPGIAPTNPDGVSLHPEVAFPIGTSLECLYSYCHRLHVYPERGGTVSENKYPAL